MIEGIKIVLDWNKIPKAVASVSATNSGDLVLEAPNAGFSDSALLGTLTLEGLLIGQQTARVLIAPKKPVDAIPTMACPSAPPQMAPKPAVPAVPDVTLDGYSFQMLLANLRNSSILTHMEIHEQLLAMKVHK